MVNLVTGLGRRLPRVTQNLQPAEIFPESFLESRFVSPVSPDEAELNSVLQSVLQDRPGIPTVSREARRFR